MNHWLARTYAWSAWQWIRFAAPWLLLGLALGAITTCTVDALAP